MISDVMYHVCHVTFVPVCFVLLVVFETQAANTPFQSACTQFQPISRIYQLRTGNSHQFQKPIRDYLLQGSVYRTFLASSHETCAVFCLQDDGCKSFNYCQTDTLCELNAAEISEGLMLKHEAGCLYFDEKYHDGPEGMKTLRFI